MSFYYSGDPSSSDVEEIRFYLGDTDEDDALLQDEEIQFYVDKLATIYGNNIATASYLADLIANRFAREVSISGDGVSIAGEQLQEKFRDLAKSLRAQWHSTSFGGPDVGGILWGEELDYTVKPLEFGTGMHDNPNAGQQEYGGVWGWGSAPGVRESYGDY